MALGINNLVEIFNEKYYENLEGGILESFGRLFRNAVKLYVYPMRQEAYDRYVSAGGTGSVPPCAGSAPPSRPTCSSRPTTCGSPPHLPPPLRPPAGEPLHRKHQRLRSRVPEHHLPRRAGQDQGRRSDLGGDGAGAGGANDQAAGALRLPDGGVRGASAPMGAGQPFGGRRRRPQIFLYPRRGAFISGSTVMRFYKYHALGNDYIVLDPARLSPGDAAGAQADPRDLPPQFRRRLRRHPLGAAGRRRRPTSACASSIPTAPRPRRAATACASSPASSGTRAW